MDYISDSDSDYEILHKPNTNKIISESENDSDNSSEDNSEESSREELLVAEEREDRRFSNRILRTSIVENSSTEESDDEIPRRANLERSIYENPQDSSSSNSPVVARKQKKKLAVPISDDEEITVKQKTQHYMINSSEEDESGSQNTKLYSSPYVQNGRFKSSSSHSKNAKSSRNVSNKNRSFKDFLDKSYDEKVSPNTTGSSSDNSLSWSQTKQIKSTMASISKSKNEVIVISSSDEGSVNIDPEILSFVEDQVGVGNIDPVNAQKSELLKANLNHIKTQQKKLQTLIDSGKLLLLPDSGKKVIEEEKALREKISRLQKKIDALPIYKTSFNSPFEIKSEDELKSPYFNRQVNNPHIDVKKGLSSLKNFKQEDLDDSLPVSIIETGRSAKTEKLEFDLKDIPKIPRSSFMTDNLGKKALETLEHQTNITHNKLEKLYGSLITRPQEHEIHEDPAGLKIKLMPHQQHALAWLIWRESQRPRGGILADDMGLGKTLTMISLVLATMNDERENKKDNSSSSENDDSDDDKHWIHRKRPKRRDGGTLVVCPASLIRQWESEIKKRCKGGLLKVLVHHGTKKTSETRQLSKPNIVITTYQTLVREHANESATYQIQWNRIILDEAHYVRNHKSKACSAVCDLSGKYRWALTGTPIQNKESDLYSIMKFLHCSPFDDLNIWKKWVENRNLAGKQRLVTIMQALMLRRTKEELCGKGNLQSLPKKNIQTIEIKLDKEEDLVYKKILLFSRNLFAQFLAQRAEKYHMRDLSNPPMSSQGISNHFTKAQKLLLDHHKDKVSSSEILTLILRLRQMCCHPNLINSMLDTEDLQINGLDEDKDVEASLISKLSNMSINQEDENIPEVNYKIDEKIATNLLTNKNPVFDCDRKSSKVRAVLKTIQDILNNSENDKVIVISQWTSFLNVIASHLTEIENASYAKFTGEIAIKNRQEIVDDFNDPDSGTNILLLSLTAGGVGLNLVGANHLLLMDIHWNPQLENQAQDRIYRFGQTKNVYIYKFICLDTIEVKIQRIQDRKIEVSNSILTGTSTVSSKLTIEDLKSLFS